MALLISIIFYLCYRNSKFNAESTLLEELKKDKKKMTQMNNELAKYELKQLDNDMLQE